VGYVAENPSARFVQATVWCTRQYSTEYRHNSRHQRLEYVHLQEHEDQRALFVAVSALKRTTRSIIGTSASVCQLTTARLINPTTPIHFAASYVNVDDSNFLKSSQFNGGSRTMQLGLRLVF